MQIINPHTISSYFQCPRKAFYSLKTNEKPKPNTHSRFGRVLTDCIKIVLADFSIDQPKDWPYFRDKLIKRIARNMTPKMGESKQILAKMINWYNNQYLDNFYYETIINVPLSIRAGSFESLNNIMIYQDNIDAISVEGPITLFNLKEEGIPDIDNRSYFREIRCWAFWIFSGVFPTRYVDLYLNSTGAIIQKIISFDDKTVERLKREITYVASGLGSDIFYRNLFSCNSCKFANLCLN